MKSDDACSCSHRRFYLTWESQKLDETISVEYQALIIQMFICCVVLVYRSLKGDSSHTRALITKFRGMSRSHINK